MPGSGLSTDPVTHLILSAFLFYLHLTDETLRPGEITSLAPGPRVEGDKAEV